MILKKTVRATTSRYFRWTPEALQRLRENPKIKSGDLADLLGCTKWAVYAKRSEIMRAKHGGRKPSTSRKLQAVSREADNRRVNRMVELSERITWLKQQKKEAA
jgi:hypothetical protein